MPSPPSPLITVLKNGRGIYLPEADLWLDPPFPAARAFVSHAHADHFARHQETYCHPLTAELCRIRYKTKKDALFTPLPYHQPLTRGDWQLLSLPAGHIPGSAMLHLTRLSDGATLLYTGDFKLRPGLSATPCQLQPADVLIMESTFGLPKYQFPPLAEVVHQLHSWIQQTLAEKATPLLLGYSLGKAQEILCAIHALNRPVMAHPSVITMTDLLRPHLPPIPELIPFDPATAPGQILLFPPSALKNKGLQTIPNQRRAALTGWALDPSAKYRLGVDLALPLSDHADFPALLETVNQVAPRLTWTIHGSTRQLAAHLRRSGHDARALGQTEQLELDLG